MNNRKEKLFARFCERVLKISIKENVAAEELLTNRVVTWMGLIAIPVFIINLVRVIILISTTPTITTIDTIHLLAMIVLMVTSVLMMATILIKMPKFRRYASFIYYMIIVVCASALATVTLFKALEAGNIPVDVIALSCVYFCLIAILPLPYIKDSIVIAGLFVAGFIVEIAVTRVAISFYLPGLIARITIALIYVFARHVHLGTMETIAESRKLNNQLVTSSYYDSLTNIFNRRALDSYWNYVCENEDIKYVGIVIFDIDDFKSYNDHYTHSHGDIILHDIATKINEFLNDQDLFLFRYGGEEFAIIITNPSDSDMTNICHDVQRIINDAKLPRYDRGFSEILTISLGASIIRADAQLTKDYIIKADKQLYMAKENGKNCFYFKDKFYR
jgi:diguanylate cyclase (GGDEF)-like protein